MYGVSKRHGLICTHTQNKTSHLFLWLRCVCGSQWNRILSHLTGRVCVPTSCSDSSELGVILWLIIKNTHKLVVNNPFLIGGVRGWSLEVVMCLLIHRHTWSGCLLSGGPVLGVDSGGGVESVHVTQPYWTLPATEGFYWFINGQDLHRFRSPASKEAGGGRERRLFSVSHYLSVSLRV